MGGYTFPTPSNVVKANVDTGQGATSRLQSWMAWGADPTPLQGGLTTNILRTDSATGDGKEVGAGLRGPLTWDRSKWNGSTWVRVPIRTEISDPGRCVNTSQSRPTPALAPAVAEHDPTQKPPKHTGKP